MAIRFGPAGLGPVATAEKIARLMALLRKAPFLMTVVDHPTSIELLEQDAEVFIFGERGKSAPKGIAGGGEAAVNVFSYENNNEWKTPPMVSKMVGIKLKKGERVRLQTPGGGGYGAPADRLQAARERDLALGYVTAGAAKKEGA